MSAPKTEPATAGMERIMENIARAFAATVIILAVWVLGRYALHEWPLLPASGSAPANPAAAVLAVLTASAVLLRVRMNRTGGGAAAGKLLAATVLGFSLLKVIGIGLGVDVVFDRLLFSDQLGGPTLNRMALNSAIVFALLGTSLLLQFAGRLARLADLLSFSGFLVIFQGAVGFLYGESVLSAFGWERAFSFRSLFAMLLLTVAVMSARPKEGFTAVLADDGAAGAAARRLMPAAFVTPFIVGMLFAGHAEPLRMPLVTLWCAVVFSVILAVVIGRLLRIDGQRLKALQDISELAKVRQDFLFRTIHDLRAPANIINVLIQDFHESSAAFKEHPEVIKGMETINDLNERMRRLVEDLAEVAKGTDTAFHLKIEPVDAFEVAAVLVGQHSAAASERRIRVELQPAQAPTVVMADKDALTEILENLIGNAIKYGKDGGVVRVSGELAGGYGRITIWDDGSGISPENIPHLFDPYFRVPKTGKPGTGLGLYIVRQFAEKMGGKAECASELGKWTAFMFTLPAAKA